MALSHMVGFTYACMKLGRIDYPPNTIADLVGKDPADAEVKRIVSDLARSTRDGSPNARRHRGVLLYSNALDIVARMLAGRTGEGE